MLNMTSPLFLTALVVLLVAGWGAISFAQSPSSQPAGQPVTEYQPDGEYLAVLETTLGQMTAELYNDQAPITVENLINLALSGYYTDLPSHRMIPGFMVQLGKHPDRRVEAKLKPIKGEFSDTLKHTEGVLSMARTSDPNSATAQFFLCFKPRGGHRSHTNLDGEYAIFGKLVDGLDVLAQIEKVPTGYNAEMREQGSKPLKPIVLKRVTIYQRQ